MSTFGNTPIISTTKTCAPIISRTSGASSTGKKSKKDSTKPLGKYLDKVISQLAEDISKLPFVDRIVLFGSRARGDDLDRADIDIAVECPSASDYDWLKVLDIVDSARTLLKIDCIRYDKLSDQNDLKQAIQKEAVCLFERKKS